MVLYKMGLVPPTSPEISDKSHEIPMFLGETTIFPMVFPWFSHGFHRTWTVGSPPCLGGPRGRAAPVADAAPAPREQCEAANASVASKEKA